MIRWLALILLGVAVWSSYPLFPNRVDSRESTVERRGESLYQKGIPFTGILVERYENGALYRETNYRKGVKQGESRIFSLAGKIKEIDRYVNGVREGLQEGWYEEGPRKFIAQYQKGLLSGEQDEWHLNGRLFRRSVYDHGTETDKKILFQNGDIFTNLSIREGRTYGIDGGSLCMQSKKEGER